MKVSQLIEGLAKALAEHGDLQVGFLDAEYLNFMVLSAVLMCELEDDAPALGPVFIGLSDGPPYDLPLWRKPVIVYDSVGTA